MTVLRKTLAIQENGEKGKLCPYMPVFHLYMFFDDFLRTGEKRKVKRLVGTVLRKTLAIQEYGEKGKICPYMPVFHFANNAP